MMSIAETIMILIFCVASFTYGLCMGMSMGSAKSETALKGVGIKEIRRCTIDTPNCQSNWYEIVWNNGKEEKK